MIEHLNADEMETIVDLAAVAHVVKTPLMLVGANARRLAFDLRFALGSPRTTRDWDFGASMENWETYARFHREAVEGSKARFRPGESVQRIIHMNTGNLVDVVPFGGLANSEGRIRWPQSKQEMSVLGFEEALETCIRHALPDGMEVGIVTPALLAALKILAYSERSEELPRDLQDLWFMVERYARPGEQMERVYEEMAGRFPDESYYEHSDALLLGWDIGRQCREGTLAAMEPILTELANEDSARLDILVTRAGDLDEQQTRRRRIAGEFGWLRVGIAMGRNAKGGRVERH